MTLITLVLLFGITAGDSKYLRVSDIRLVGGSGTYGGRVEINVNGVWGTVCDDKFNMKTAEVMCRMMNLKPTACIKGGYFGNGSGPIFARYFSCYGGESSLDRCSYVDNSLCTHARDVGIICTECGEIGTKNGDVNISSDGKVLSTTCHKGFTSRHASATCQNRNWSVSSISCNLLDISDIRLVDGVGIADGRVEILVNGSWGTICSTSFGVDEEFTVCRMLGFDHSW